MKTIPIPGTNLLPATLCLGTGQYGSAIDRQDAYRQMDTYCEFGGNFLDTAKVYGDWVPGTTSLSEKVIGSWLQERRNRQKIILATKGAHYFLETPHTRRVTRTDILADITASLEHLQTDYIDLYWLHRDDPSQPVVEILETLESQVKAGKIRYYGASNWRLSRLGEAQEIAQVHGMLGFCAVQNCWSLAKINQDKLFDPTMAIMDDELWHYHLSHQIAAIPYSSQANGIFHKMADGGKDNLPKMVRNMFLNTITEQRLTNILRLVEQTGLTITQVVMGYLLSQPFPTIPVFSSRSLEQMADTLSAADIQLTSDQIRFLVG